MAEAFKYSSPDRLVRLGGWDPFAEINKFLGDFKKVGKKSNIPAQFPTYFQIPH